MHVLPPFQLLFLANSSYIFGVLFHGSSRISNFYILFVDYDGGDIGESIRGAYNQLSSPSFVTFHEVPPSDYESKDQLHEAVCRGDYWGAIYTASNASQKLSGALDGSIGEPYNPATALSAYNMGVRYPIIQQSYITSQMNSLVSVAKTVYFSTFLEAQDISNLFSSTTEDIAPIPQATNPFYNTASTVFIILMQFFYVLAFNGIFASFNAAKSFSPYSFLRFRYFYSIIFTFIGSLLTVAYL